MDIKRLGPVDFKAGDKGEFSAVIATYGVIDSDGDVTEPGAHRNGQKAVVSPYGHASMMGTLPVGTAVLKTEAGRTVAEGQYFMDMPEGRSAFTAMKRLYEQGLGEWSYGYEIVDAEMGEMDGQRVRFLKQVDVYEVSHVLRGAGVGTGTLAAKDGPGTDQIVPVKEKPVEVEYKAAIRPHGTPVTARAWDGTAVVSAIADDASVSDLRSVYAWVDSNGDPEAKTNYRFPHHHGPGGPANVRALVTGIAVLNGARGGTTIPDGDRKAVYNHLASHLRDDDREPPELKEKPGGELKFFEEGIDAMAVVATYLESAQRVIGLRAVRGKALSHVNTEVLDWLLEDWAKLGHELKALRDTPRERAATELVRFLALDHQVAS
ncbi:MAG: HK97 family phage prohead protease [Acidimicrobiales bacterium]